MKADKINITDVSMDDRLATLEEVRRAISGSEDGVLHFCHADGNYCEMGSDLGGVIRYPAEEFEFFAYLSDMDENVPN